MFSVVDIPRKAQCDIPLHVLAYVCADHVRVYRNCSINVLLLGSPRTQLYLIIEVMSALAHARTSTSKKNATPTNTKQ